LTELLVSGGDARLRLAPPLGRNIYGCAPAPLDGVIDFASSTASSISQEAYERVSLARDGILARSAIEGPDAGFQSRMASLRRDLLECLDLDGGTEIIFSPSGTDAQLQALFLVMSRLGAPVTAIIAGADQTGSGTAFTAHGRHFSPETSDGTAVEKGAVIDGFANKVRKVEISFAREDGVFRSPAEMDAAVLEAVRNATANGEKILLQAMDASKLGWRAPSDACLAEIMRRWPGQVQVVMDACQMRLTQERLKDLLASGFLVLITGSKFFTGPPFSGALLIPGALAPAFATVRDVPAGLQSYTSRFDWPVSWALSRNLPVRRNHGQWLRWVAALEEMKCYFAVPCEFRESAGAALFAGIEQAVLAAPVLKRLPTGLHGDGKDATILSFVPYRRGVPMLLEDISRLYRSLGRDLSLLVGAGADIADLQAAAAPCHIGQPVALPGGGAVLRMSVSARMIRQCWSQKAALSSERMAMVRGNAEIAVRKLALAIANFDKLSP
jgi:hypothetical protein